MQRLSSSGKRRSGYKQCDAPPIPRWNHGSRSWRHAYVCMYIIRHTRVDIYIYICITHMQTSARPGTGRYTRDLRLKGQSTRTGRHITTPPHRCHRKHISRLLHSILPYPLALETLRSFRYISPSIRSCLSLSSY